MKHYTEEQKSTIRSIDIAKYTPKAALYEQLAEEASELSQAAIKCAIEKHAMKMVLPWNSS